MKYKCIKDFWMENESEENGNIPAFKAGKVSIDKKAKLELELAQINEQLGE